MKPMDIYMLVAGIVSFFVAMLNGERMYRKYPKDDFAVFWGLFMGFFLTFCTFGIIGSIISDYLQ